jgi:hypothetical protein
MAIFSTGHSPAGRCEPRALVTYIDLTSVNIVLISPERKAHVEVARHRARRPLNSSRHTCGIVDLSG